MASEGEHKIGDSLNEAGRSLRAVINSAYDLAPFAVTLLLILSVGLVWLTAQWTVLMTGTAVILILILSLSLFAIRGNFGEALLSLVGGLLSVFAYEWTVERYIAFSIAWIGFALFAILIASIKIAAKNEDIYRQAAIRLVGAGVQFKETEKKLKAIASKTELRTLGPLKRGEIIRMLAFRGLDIELFGAALSATETLSVITNCDENKVSLFVADFFQSFKPGNDTEARRITDMLYLSIRSTPVPPVDYFLAFEKSRRLVVSKSIDATKFLAELKACLSDGVANDDILKEIQHRHENGE